ncbi:MAG: hypothetical protein J2P50_07695 [Hyphomicrobiaceae bacterium]|nr:hypothetical protein [Hyphomicrobiaceae bacterium]
MRSWLLAAGLIAAAAASPALAADIDGVPPPRHGPYGGPYSGPYDDPHYAPKAPPQSYYDDDDDDGRYEGRPPPQKYTYTPPRYASPPPGRTCVRSEEVRDRLTSQGWNNFHDGKPVSEGLVSLRARRPSGRLFELTLHRCSGEVLEARPLEPRPAGPYAYRQPSGPYEPWRWGPATAAPYGHEDDGWQDRPYADRGQRRWGD